MTFVRTRLALDALAPGQILRVTLADGEPADSVPRQAASLGHEILSLERLSHGRGWTLLLRRR